MGSLWTSCSRIHSDDPFHWCLVVQVTHSMSRLSAYIINSKLRNLAHQDPHSLVSLHFLRVLFLLLFFMPTRMNKNDDYQSLPSLHSDFDTLYHHPASITCVSIASAACQLESHFSKKRPCAPHKQKPSLLSPILLLLGQMWNKQGW